MSPAFEVGKSGQFPVAGDGVFVFAEFRHMSVFDAKLHNAGGLGADFGVVSGGAFGGLTQA